MAEQKGQFSLRVLIPLMYMHACVLSCLSWIQLFETLWTVAHQSPLSVEFSRKEYWNGLPFPTPRLSSHPRDWTHVSSVSCICRQILHLLSHKGAPNSLSLSFSLLWNGIDDESETQILWLPDLKSWLIRKDPDAGKEWRQEKKGMAEDEMVR